MIGERVELVVPGRSRYLPMVRGFFEVFAEECPDLNLDDREKAEVLLVLQEASINAVRYADPGAGVHELHVVFEVEADRLVIEVHDRGPGFDPDSIPVPDTENLQEGGYGVYIMKRSMDLVEARHEGGCFVLSMTKYLKPSRCEAADR